MRKGIALIVVILVTAIFLLLASFFTKMVYNSYVSAKAFEQREEAFWLAEAGLEAGKAALKNNINWFTEVAHQPKDDVSWLRNAAQGQNINLGKGSFKAVREAGENYFYSIGYLGKAIVMLKISFSYPPLVFNKWEEL